MASERSSDLLIVFHETDRGWGEWIAWQCADAGYSTILQPAGAIPDSVFFEVLQASARSAGRLLALLSPALFAQGTALEVWDAVFAAIPPGEGGPPAWLQIADCRAGSGNAPIARVGLDGLGVHLARERLLAVLGGRRRSKGPPAGPGGMHARMLRQRPEFLGGNPRIWNVPFARNPYFAGREELLDHLRTALAVGRPVALEQAIHGLGGVGKRQIAVEYAFRFAADYDAVCWIPARSPITLREGFAALAAELGLRGGEAPDQPAEIQAAETWLREHERYLLVIENAGAPADVAEFLPSDLPGHVLITARQGDWGEAAHTISVPILSREESVQLVCRRTGQGDETMSGILASEMGDFPLALAQAAGYIATARVPLVPFRELYHARRRELWKAGAGPADHPRTIATLWDLAQRKLDDPVIELLRLCAHLGSEGIPLWLFAEHPAELPWQLRGTAANPLQLAACVHDLSSYALIEATGEMIWVHPLVQTAVAESLSEFDRRRLTQVALRLLTAVFNAHTDGLHGAGLLSPLVHHALDVLANARARKLQSSTCGRLANRLGVYFWHRRNLIEARRLLQQAIEIKQRAYTSDHPTLATSCTHLGLVEKESGNLAEALRLLHQALAISEVAYARDHPTLAASYANAGLAEQASGNLEPARRLLAEALRIAEQGDPLDHCAVAAAHARLALVEQDLGNMTGACLHMRKACAIRLENLGENDPGTQEAVDWLVRNDADFQRARLEKKD